MTKDDAPKKTAPKAPNGPQAEHLYSANDPIPVPEAIESDTDTAWGLWEDLTESPGNAADRAFAHTVPAELMPEQDGFKDKPPRR